LALQSLTTLLDHKPSPGEPPITHRDDDPGRWRRESRLKPNVDGSPLPLRGSRRRQLTVAPLALDDIHEPHPGHR
jgi:hypothetical protein